MRFKRPTCVLCESQRLQSGFIREARDYMALAHSMARDEDTKFRLGKELEILEISADIYRKPTNEFEVVGKTLLEAELAPVEKLVPILMKVGYFLDSNFDQTYEIHQNLFPVNESFSDTYKSGFKPLRLVLLFNMHRDLV